MVRRKPLPARPKALPEAASRSGRGRLARGYLDTIVQYRDTDGGAEMSAREEVLLRGLIDWVALERVHWIVARANAGESLAVIQDKVLDLIRSLVTEGLLELGDLATEDNRFRARDITLDESIQRVREVYTTKFQDEPEWWFYCWLDPTEKGLAIAEAIETRREATRGR
jgi:hypothetical protein